MVHPLVIVVVYQDFPNCIDFEYLQVKTYKLGEWFSSSEQEYHVYHHQSMVHNLLIKSQKQNLEYHIYRNTNQLPYHLHSRTVLCFSLPNPNNLWDIFEEV